MKFAESLEYPMPLDVLEEMSLDPAFVRSRFACFCDSLDVVVEGRSVRATGAVSDRLIPQAARAVVRGEVSVEFTEEWSGEGAARRATSLLVAKGAPVEVSLASTFSGAETTSRKVAGDLSVKIPFFGGKLEKEAVERVSLVLAEETRLAAAWLKDR